MQNCCLNAYLIFHELRERWLCLKQYFENKSICLKALSAKIPKNFFFVAYTKISSYYQ